jgi:DnaJ-class molecular chaperone
MGESIATIRVAPEGAYALLGVRPGAPRDEVRSAYRRLVRSYHPDTAARGGSAERLGAVVAAYRTVVASAPEPRPAPRRHVDVYA